MAPIDLPAPLPVQCEIAAQRTDSTVRLQGLVAASSAASGRYRLRITKRGPAGSTNLNQAGDFVVKPGTKTVLGHASISLEPGGQFTAVLVLETAERSYECRRSGEY